MIALERIAWALLCLVVFTVPWEKSLSIEGVGTITRLLGMAAFAAGSMAAIRRGSIRPPNAALVFAAAFVAWSGLTWFWSLAPADTAIQAFTFAQLFILVYLLWDQCRPPERQDRLLQMYLCGTALACINAILRYSQGQQTYYRRYAAAGFDPNEFGLTLALSIPIALYLAMRARGPRQWVYRAAAVLAIVAVLLTASRAALIATFIAFAFLPWTWRKSDIRQRVSGVALFALLLLSLTHLAPTSSRERLATIAHEVTRGTLHNRTAIWKSGLKVFKHHSVLGIGTGAYPEAVRPWLGVPGVPGHRYVAHNTFLSVLVESGAIGFGLFSLLLGTLAVFVWIMPSTERAFWAVMIMVWIAGVSTLTWEHRKPTWLFIALITTEWARSFQGARKAA